MEDWTPPATDTDVEEKWTPPATDTDVVEKKSPDGSASSPSSAVSASGAPSTEGSSLAEQVGLTASSPAHQLMWSTGAPSAPAESLKPAAQAAPPKYDVAGGKVYRQDGQTKGWTHVTDYQEAEDAKNQIAAQQKAEQPAQLSQEISQLGNKTQAYRDKVNALAAVHIQQGDLTAARDAYTKNLINNPDDVNSKLGVAWIDNHQGNYTEAIKSLDDVITKVPSNPLAWSYRAYAEQQAGNYKKALTDVMVAEKINPRDPAISKLKAGIYTQLGDQQRAAQSKTDESIKADNLAATPMATTDPVTGQQMTQSPPLNSDPQAPTFAGLPSHEKVMQWQVQQPQDVQDYNKKIQSDLKTIDWFSKGGAGGTSNTWAEKVVGMFLNPVGWLGETERGMAEASGNKLIEGAKGTVPGNVEYAQDTTPMHLGSYIKIANGLIGLGMATLTPTAGGVAFNAAATAAPDEMSRILMQPITTLLDPKTDLGKEAAALADVAVSVIGIKAAEGGVTSLANIAKTKLAEGELTQPQTEALKNAALQLKPQEIANAKNVMASLPENTTEKQFKDLYPLLLDVESTRKGLEGASPMQKLLLSEKAKDLELQIKNKLIEIKTAKPEAEEEGATKSKDNATNEGIKQQSDVSQREGAGGQLQEEGKDRNLIASEQTGSNQTGGSNSVQQGGEEVKKKKFETNDFTSAPNPDDEEGKGVKPFRYNQNPKLSPGHQAIEKKFGDDLQTNYERRKKEYIEKFGHDVSADNAAEMSPDYVANRGEMSSVVHGVAATFAKSIEGDLLNHEPPKGKDKLLEITSGGSGAGKTTSTHESGAGIVYDSNFDNFEHSKRYIQEAVDKGWKVRVNYVFRDPIKAFKEGVVSRIAGDAKGRVVPVDVHVHTHIQALDNVKKLAEEYKDDPNVVVDIHDNSGKIGEAKEIKVADLPQKPYIRSELENQLYGHVEELRKSGAITESQYKGFVSKNVEGLHDGAKGEDAVQGAGSTALKTEPGELERSRKSSAGDSVIGRPGGSDHAESESAQGTLRRSADNYVNEHSKEFNLPGKTLTKPNIKVDEKRSSKIAAAYDELPEDDSANPAVRKAYGQLGKEVQAQYDYMTNKLGIKTEFTDGDPYANSKEMTRDVMDNKHLFVYRGGEDHPLLGSKTADKNGLTLNEKLRAVHDFFGHALEGNEFGKNGEERAWLAHSKMFSPEAQRALTTETRGQNSWVNFSGVNKGSLAKITEGHKLINAGDAKAGERLIEEGRKEFQFAKQKVGLLPQEFSDWHIYDRAPEGATFSSPNVTENDMTFEQAQEKLRTPEHKVFHQMSAEIDKELGLTSETMDGVGDWTDGAENSLVSIIKDAPDFDTVAYSAALKGRIGNQKAVLPFMEQAGGKDALYAFDTPYSMAEARAALDKAGLSLHTLIQTEKGTRILLFDKGLEDDKLIHKFATDYGKGFDYYQGRGEYLGGGTREEGAAAFNSTINKYESDTKTSLSQKYDREGYLKRASDNGNQDARTGDHQEVGSASGEGAPDTPKEPRGLALAAEGTHELAQALGLVKNIIGEERPDAKKALVKIARGLMQEAGTTFDNLIEKIKGHLKTALGLSDKKVNELVDAHAEDLKGQIVEEVSAKHEKNVSKMLEEGRTPEQITEWLKRKGHNEETAAAVIGKVIENTPDPEAKAASQEEVVKTYLNKEKKWLGNKELGRIESVTKANEYLQQIKESVGKKGDWKRALNAIHLYNDIKGLTPEEIAELKSKIDPKTHAEELKDLEAVQNLTDKQKEIADQMDKDYQALGKRALNEGVIRDLRDNYVNRAWDLTGKSPTEISNKFATSTKHAQQRTLPSILHGYAEGLHLKVKGSPENLSIVEQEINNLIENKKLIEEGSKIKDSEGNPAFSTVPLAGYEKINHPAFRKWGYAGKLEDYQAAERQMMGSHKDFMVSEDGTVIQKKDIYAPKQIADGLNNILGQSALNKIPGIDVVTKANAFGKQSLLLFGFFHHLNFLRAHYLSSPDILSHLNPNKAYHEGLKVIKEAPPEFKAMIDQGLTIGKNLDYGELYNNPQKTINNKIASAIYDSKAYQKLRELASLQHKFLFEQFGAGLKTLSAMSWYGELAKSHPDWALERIAKAAADVTNDNYGGLNLAMLHRNPTVQHIFRMMTLAPDWTESNIRKFAGAFQKGDTGAVHRQMWANVIMRGTAATMFANVALSLMQDDKEPGEPADWWNRFTDRYRRAWDAGKLRWTMVDVTPMAHALGADPEKNHYFSIFGMYADPIKLVSGIPQGAASYITNKETPLGNPKDNQGNLGDYIGSKSSPLARMIKEGMTSQDWKGMEFTTVPEVLGKDEKGFYKKEVVNKKTGMVHGEGEEKGGQLTGSLTKPGDKIHFIQANQIPSFALNQVRGLIPIPLQNSIKYFQGEMDGFSAVSNSVGAGVVVNKNPDDKPEKE